MAEAERATGPAKDEAEARAADLVLRLWARRRDLPAAADPLGSYREAIAVLSRLLPDRNPWAVYARHDGPEQVFHALFDCMARVVVCSLLLTVARPPREVAPAEEAAMEREELELREHLDWWEKAIPQALPSIVKRLVGTDDKLAVPSTDSAKEGETPAAAVPRSTGGQPPAQSAEDGVEEVADEEEDFNGNEADDVSGDLAARKLRAHEAVTVHLERLQQELATLVERWRVNSGQP